MIIQKLLLLLRREILKVFYCCSETYFSIYMKIVTNHNKILYFSTSSNILTFLQSINVPKNIQSTILQLSHFWSLKSTFELANGKLQILFSTPKLQINRPPPTLSTKKNKLFSFEIYNPETHQSLGSSLGRMFAKMTSSMGRERSEMLWNISILMIRVCLARFVKVTAQIFLAASFIRTEGIGNLRARYFHDIPAYKIRSAWICTALLPLGLAFHI